MSEQMPSEIWTDINGYAARTQFKGGVKYIRADLVTLHEDALKDQLWLLNRVQAHDDAPHPTEERHE